MAKSSFGAVFTMWFDGGGPTEYLIKCNTDWRRRETPKLQIVIHHDLSVVSKVIVSTWTSRANANDTRHPVSDLRHHDIVGSVRSMILQEVGR